ncbi:MAG: 30S ribosomal protein S6--L-glutamate ligase [Polyangiales bacterium]
MRIGLLTQYPENGSSSRLITAARKSGHRLRPVNYVRSHITMSAGVPHVVENGKNLPLFDAVIPRISASATFHGTAIVRQFEMQGVYTPSSSVGIKRSRDKLHSLQLMAGRGIAMPITAFGHPSGDAHELIDAVGGAPLIVKIIEGTQGIGVVLCEQRASAQSAIEAFRALGGQIVVQEYIRESKGEDLRCFVVGDEVVGAMVRVAAKGEFRANLHRGGKGRSTTLTDDEKSVALRAAQAMGLGIAGVDILRSDRGPLVIEVNSSPGLMGIEAATKKNIAARVIDYVVTNAKR